MSEPKELLGQDKSEFNVLFVHSELDDAGLTPAEFRVYAHLARRANKGRESWPGIDSMAVICKINRETAIDAIKELEKRKMLDVKRRQGKGNLYILTKRSSWDIPKLPTDRSSFPTSRKSGTRPVGNRERKDIQEGNPYPAGRSGEVVHNQADRIAAIFKRRKNTPWSEKEVKAWKKLTKKEPLHDDELTMIERYYAEARKKSDNICRRDLLTFLNNYHGEVDRARSWCEKHPLPGSRKIVKKGDAAILEKAMASRPPEDPAETKAFCEKFERQFHRLPAGYKRDGEEIIFVGSGDGQHEK